MSWKQDVINSLLAEDWTVWSESLEDLTDGFFQFCAPPPYW